MVYDVKKYILMKKYETSNDYFLTEGIQEDIFFKNYMNINFKSEKLFFCFLDDKTLYSLDIFENYEQKKEYDELEKKIMNIIEQNYKFEPNDSYIFYDSNFLDLLYTIIFYNTKDVIFNDFQSITLELIKSNIKMFGELENYENSIDLYENFSISKKYIIEKINDMQ